MSWPKEAPKTLWFLNTSYGASEIREIPVTKISAVQIVVPECSVTNYRTKFYKDQLGHVFFLTDKDAYAALHDCLLVRLKRYRESLVDTINRFRRFGFSVPEEEK